jgi:virulence factor Mce-like protein
VRRVLAAVVIVGVCAAAVLFTGAAEEDEGKTYKILFDNAFGLVKGGDFRVANVTAGSTSDFKVTDDVPPKAEVTVEVAQPGFDDLREDATCEIKPQSLIGEYYVTCQPGEGKALSDGGRVPVEQTSSTIPQDLVNNILRRPYRERLRLIISELGTGLAGRPEDLSEAIRRAHPGLRETSKVLRILGNQNRIIEGFIADADTVVAELERNKKDVARWVVEAGETSEISASRREDIRRSFERLPSFLEELQPTMARLGDLADEQTPLLTEVRRAAPDLEEFVTRLGPFAEASRPALRSLGETSEVGTRAFRKGAQEVAELKRLAPEAPPLFKPLRQFLFAFDQRERATDNDQRATVNGPPPDDPSYAGGRGGFTAFESIWNYPFWQTLSLNNYDRYGHLLRIGVTFSECSPYHNEGPESPADEAFFEKCNDWLGPDQPGITTPDFTEGAQLASLMRAAATPASEPGERRAPGEPDAAPLPGQPDISRPQLALPPQLQDLLDQLEQGELPDSGVPQVDELLDTVPNLLDGLGLTRPGAANQPNPTQLLDFLLAP